jgi:hypothetical protein
VGGRLLTHSPWFGRRLIPEMEFHPNPSPQGGGAAPDSLSSHSSAIGGREMSGVAHHHGHHHHPTLAGSAWDRLA